jgi:hypothetical protein
MAWVLTIAIAGSVVDEPGERFDGRDKAPPLDAGEAPRPSTSSLDRVFNLIRRLFSPRPHTRTQSAWDGDPNRFVYVKVPGGKRLEDPLQIASAEPLDHSGRNVATD